MLGLETASRGRTHFTLCVCVCVCARLESQVSSVQVQSPSCAGVGGERDSGYVSLRRRMSVLDRLSLTHPAWLLLTLSAEEATLILLQQPPGVNNYDLFII